ncbi:hypothetical protein MSG28_002261 [Choristoneura fumiferana]|uniref:Uncharacterized protein n=1 Tax=Choristoneura fumiferana TaxID=7141 RepID=A0ACC0JUU0_CHOFU|nr:hypothetical protein MSG28_002261 [Choristoneura fumiferana]
MDVHLKRAVVGDRPAIYSNTVDPCLKAVYIIYCVVAHMIGVNTGQGVLCVSWSSSSEVQARPSISEDGLCTPVVVRPIFSTAPKVISGRTSTASRSHDPTSCRASRSGPGFWGILVTDPRVKSQIQNKNKTKIFSVTVAPNVGLEGFMVSFSFSLVFYDESLSTAFRWIPPIERVDLESLLVTVMRSSGKWVIGTDLPYEDVSLAHDLSTFLILFVFQRHDHPALNSNSNTAGPCLKVVYIIYCVVTQMLCASEDSGTIIFLGGRSARVLIYLNACMLALVATRCLISGARGGGREALPGPDRVQSSRPFGIITGMHCAGRPQYECFQLDPISPKSGSDDWILRKLRELFKYCGTPMIYFSNL